MVTYVRDTTGRFQQRPHYKPEELDLDCEKIISGFLKDRYGKISYPISTEDVKTLIERDVEDLDVYADLSCYGPDVEGVTEFRRRRKPRVLISAYLTEDERRENRLRTTLTHEYGHVRFHNYLWALEAPLPDLMRQLPNSDKQICKRDTMLDAAQTDWMEWQAGYACGAFLMPKSAVRQVCREYAESKEVYGIVSQQTAHGQELLTNIMTRFQVSEEAARVRLMKLGLLTSDKPTQSLFG